MGPSNEEIIKAIYHYQERLERYILSKSEDKILYVIQKLSRLPIKTSHLETTGVGRTVNALKKLNGRVGDSAKDLVMSWKEMVLEEENATQETSMETEEDADSVYSEDNSQQIEEKEDLVIQSDKESDSEDFSDKKEVPTSSQKYLENIKSKYKKYNNHKSHSSTNSSSSDEGVSSRHSRKRDRSESSSDEGSRTKLKKNKRENSSSNHHNDKSKTAKDERTKKQEKIDKHVSSSNKSNDDRTKAKHKSNRESEKLDEKSEKRSKHKDKTEKDKSSHFSKHESSSSHSSKKDSKDKKGKHDSKKESSSSRSSEKKSRETSKDEKKKSKDSSSSSTSHSRDKPSSSENGTRKEKKDKVKNIAKEKIINGIDSESGASFAEALGLCGPVSSHSSKKKNPEKKSPKPIETKSSDSSRSKKSRHEESSSTSLTQPTQFVPDLLVEEPPETLNICLSSLLPEITPNYKPTPINLDLQSKRIINDDEALSRVMSNKNQRTKVYSGNKTFGKVESLFQSCVRVLQDNIDALEYTGGVPYMILKPILDRATPDQLFNLEHHNPYLIEDTDELWQLHCQKEFRTKKRDEMESWREMYMRCLDERERRLNFITANIKQSQDKSEPVRTTKMAFIDSAFVKPPRNIARKQAKNGTETTDRKVSPSQKLSSLAKSGGAEKIQVPNPGSRAVERSNNSSSAAIKPKKAPLMAKTLSFLKNRFKR